jgi:hypothetical protein
MNQAQQPPEPAVIEADADFTPKAGALPTTWDEARRFPRFYYRTRVPATIHPLAESSGQQQHCTVLTRDLSRGGLNLLHCEQLFPGQKIDLTLTEGAPRRVEVMWCRRLAARCYSAGCRFIKLEEAVGKSPDAASQHDA